MSQGGPKKVKSTFDKRELKAKAKSVQVSPGRNVLSARMYAKKKKLDPQALKDLVSFSCGGSPNVFSFTPNWQDGFQTLAVTLWRVMFKRGTFANTFAPGYWYWYLVRCYASYLFANQAWENIDNDIPGSGQFPVPEAIALIFQQCSTYKHKKTKYEYKVKYDGDPASVFTADVVDIWYGSHTPLFSGADFTYSSIVQSLSYSSISTNFWSTMVDVLNANFKTKTVLVKDIPWGAKSAELFVGKNGTSLSKVYPWSQVVSLLVPGNYDFVGFQMEQGSDTDDAMVIYDILLNSRNNSKSVANCLLYNGYDPIMFATEAFLFDSVYFAQICWMIWDSIGGSDQDFRMWVSFCWSYVASFFPIVSLDNMAYLSDPGFQNYKVPWPLQFLARQSSVRVGSTYYYVLNQGVWNYTATYTGANTVTSFVGSWGQVGFVSTDVPGPVYLGPGNEITSFNTTAGVFSWTNAVYAYKYFSKQYPALMTLARTMPGDMHDCACFAHAESTLASDIINSATLGTLSPKVVYRLSCSSNLPVGMCSAASALTVRSHTNDPNTTLDYRTPLATFNTSMTITNLDAVLSSMIALPGTNLSVLQAAKGSLTNFVYEELSGGYDWLKLNKEDIVEIVSGFVVGTPIVEKMKNSAYKSLANQLPAQVSLDEVAGFMSKVGWPAVSAVASVLATKSIGFAKTRLRTEL